MRDSGGEDIIVSAGLCSDGTAKNVFGEKADYYQSMHAIIILSEAVWRLYWEAFESWTAERDNTKGQGSIEDVLKTQLDSTVDVSEQLVSIQTCQPQVVFLQEQLLEFQNSLADLPTAVFWSNVLEMSDILHRFVYYQREGDWM